MMSLESHITAIENGLKFIRSMIAFSSPSEMEFYQGLQKDMELELSVKKRQNAARKLLAILKDTPLGIKMHNLKILANEGDIPAVQDEPNTVGNKSAR